MSEDRKKPGAAFWATVVVVVGLATIGAYAGLYLCMVDEDGTVFPVVGEPYTLPEYCWGEDQCTNQQFWGAFFSPVHWVDRKIRQDKWRER